MTPTKDRFDHLERFREVVYYCNECRCGFCREDCPAFAAVKRESVHARGVSAIAQGLLDGAIHRSQGLAESLALCTTCGWCTQRCSLNMVDEFVRVKGRKFDMPQIVEALREELMKEGLVPQKVKDFLENILKYGNPWKLPREKRIGWTSGTKVRNYRPSDELLYFVGCTGSYDTRGNEVARALGEILLASGVAFGILGRDEDCDGNDVKTLGEEGLFQLLADKNMQMFRKFSVKKIVTLSPHAYNAMKNSYPHFDRDFEVMHYTQFLRDSIRTGKLKISEGCKMRVTYHDPCFLGRYNKEYSAPREVLRSIPGIDLVEMPRNRENSFCCGGGGANFYTGLLGGRENNPGRIRVREAYDTGAEVLAVACPNCMTMLEDAVKQEELEGKLSVKDISEILRCYVNI